MVALPAPIAAAETLSRSELDACGSDAGWLCLTLFRSTGNEQLSLLLDRVAMILLIVALAAIAHWLAHRAIGRVVRRAAEGGKRQEEGRSAGKRTGEGGTRARQRAHTIGVALRSVTAIAIWTVAGLVVLGEIGVSLGPLIAGAGVVGVALGFGAQTLIRDFINGIFILIEDQYGVGDIVDVGSNPGEIVGTVEAVAIRRTRLRTVDGTVWHIPNGEILRVGNLSQEWSRALLDVEVAYDTDLSVARETLERVSREVAEREAAVLGEPEVWGVEALGASGITLRVVVRTKPAEQWRIMRELRERIKEAFDEAGIEIPFPQQTTWVRAHEPPPT